MTSPAPERGRRFAVGVAGWVFGLASTVLLLGVWGRAVVTDTHELATSLSPLAASDLVAERISSWLESELIEAGAAPAGAATTAAEILTHPDVGPVLEQIVAEGVEAAASEDPTGSAVDVAAILVPASERITAGLNEAGLPVSRAQVEAALARLDPLVVRTASESPWVGASSPLAQNLGTAAFLGALLMVVSGVAFVAMSPDRLRAVRALLSRFALGALSFAFLLRIGAWLVDPEGGRAPVRESFALVADSKWTLPLVFGLVAAAASAAAWSMRKRLRPGADSPIGPGSPTPREAPPRSR